MIRDDQGDSTGDFRVEIRSERRMVDDQLEHSSWNERLRLLTCGCPGPTKPDTRKYDAH